MQPANIDSKIQKNPDFIYLPNKSGLGFLAFLSCGPKGKSCSSLVLVSAYSKRGEKSIPKGFVKVSSSQY